jgi:transcriptional regulator with XRE-family HTH domain
MAQKIGESVKRLREARCPKLSQAKLAEAVGISRSTINAIERGRRDHDHSTIQRIADFLGVPIGEITGESASTKGLTERALELARMYDALEPDEQAVILKFVRGISAAPPSSR